MRKLSKAICILFAILVLFTSTSYNKINAYGALSNEETSRDTISVVMGEEPSTLDPTYCNTLDGAAYIQHAFEGLTRIDASGKAVPGMAKSWEILDKGTRYIFHLRDAKWSDGKPVRAQDFEYAWKRALNPRESSEYAYLLYCIKNALEYNASHNPDYTGPKAKISDVGIKAKDDKTLEVRLQNPTVYFTNLLYYSVFMPVRSDIISKYKNKWTNSPQTYVCNGAYKMENWSHNNKITFVKNLNYWDEGKIKFNKINWVLMNDSGLALNAFESGDVDVTYDLVPTEEVQRLTKEGSLKIYNKLGTYYLDFNLKKAPLNKLKVRKALSLAIDRKNIVEKVTMAGEKPATGFVPFGTRGESSKKDFRTEITKNTFLPAAADVKNAKKLLAEAGYPNGKGFPKLQLIYNKTGNHKEIMQAIQGQWKRNLDINVTIKGMEWRTLYSRRYSKNYSIARDGWIGDCNDPINFLEMWISNGFNNNTDWSNSKYDQLIKTAQSSTKTSVRMKAMHEAEKILMTEMPICPIYFYTTRVLQKSNIKDMVVTPEGYLGLHYAYFQ